MKKRILVVSRDVRLRSTAARYLKSAGYAVELAESEERARVLLTTCKINSAILEPRSLSSDARELASELQATIGQVFVLANAADEVAQLATALPDVTLLKQPVAWPDLLDRLAKQLAPVAHPGHDDLETRELLTFEGRTVDLAGNAFYENDGREVSLTRAEFQLLTVFIRKPGRVLSRDQLRTALVGRSSDAYDRSIDMLVARLRRKIEPDPKAPRFILTVPGAGYKFAARPQRTLSSTTAASARRESPELAMSDFERRQVTVMACQIVGILAFASKIDPEEMYATKEQVCRSAADIVKQFGGMMVKVPGDRLLFYFGYPEAQENDAEQAVRAALTLARGMSNIKTASPTTLQLRVGIATGVLLMGGAEASQNHSATGEPLNLALHLQHAAPLNGVVIAGATHELLGRLFDCEELKPFTLEDGLESQLAWRVVGENPTPKGRFDALRRSRMLQLIGRDEQIDLLLRCWEQARRGAGRVVMLTGEPGIGKSRLVAELELLISDASHTGLKYSGLPHQIDASMFAVISELQAACGFERTDDEPEKISKLEAIIDAAGVNTATNVALIADLLSLPTKAKQKLPQRSPQERKRDTLAALLERVKGLAMLQPALVIVEDIHWIDPASLEFLSMLVEQVAALPILVIVTARPEFSSPWSGHPHVVVVDLPRLPRTAAEALVEHVAGDVVLPKEVTDQILAPTEGVPLFVEELTKSVLEAGQLRDGKMHYEFDGHHLTIPRTLHGSLLARLDRLGASKEVAQIGAVIGREFSHELLCAVTPMQEPVLRSALDQLRASGLVHRHGALPLATYVFKHALVRDAAYGMLSNARRRELHGAIAKALEDGFGELAQTQPELLAHHYKAADNVAKAVEHLTVAGERALSYSALTEAYTQIAEALQLVSRLPEDDTRKRQELKLRIALARTLLEQKGYADRMVGAAYSEAYDLSERINDARGQLAGLYGMWAHHYIRGEPEVMLKKASEFLAFAESQEQNGEADTSGPGVIGHRLVGTSLLINGNISGATTALNKALVGYDPAEHGATSKVGRDLRARFGQDLGITIYSYQSWAQFLSGRPDQAAATAKTAIDQGRTLKHDHQSLFYALWHAGLTYVLLRNGTEVARLGNELTKHANSRGLRYWLALGSFLRGWHATHTNRPAEAVELLQHGLQLWDQTGSRVFRPICLAFLAEAYALAGRQALASDTFEAALGIAAETGERWAEPEIRRLFGDALARGKSDLRPAAIAQYEQAITLSRRQKSRSFELRAATSLVRTAPNRAEGREWRNRLSKIHETFTEGFDTPDLVDARAMLATKSVSKVQ